MRFHLASLFYALIFSCLLGYTFTTIDNQNSTADLVDLVRPAVVQVAVKISGIPTMNAIPPSLANCFRTLSVCTVGTGFFVNSDGDVVTASHVANGGQGNPSELGIQQIIQILAARGIQATSIIAVSIPNVETSHIVVSGGIKLFSVELTAVDPQHDIAIFHTKINPFTNMPKTFAGLGTVGFPQTKATFVQLSLRRPRDGEEVFACGFPFGEPGLVITSGAIASAWKSETLITAAGTQNPMSIGAYWADLSINPGNSGGPVFRPRDQAVIGMAVESKGNLGVLVPSKYISDFLQIHGIKWNQATDTH